MKTATHCALAPAQVELFLETEPQRLNELAHAVARDDLAAARATAHRMRGAFGRYGLAAIAATARRIEQAAAAGDVDTVRSAFLELDEAFAAVVADLEGRAASEAPWDRIAVEPLAGRAR